MSQVKVTEFEMKSILKAKTTKQTHVRVKLEDVTQSSSIGAVRWPFPEENTQAHSSAPSGIIKCSSTSSRMQQNIRQQGLKDLRNLQECVIFINEWKDQVERVCKNSSKDEQQAQEADPHAERSLEESRKLILQWAQELNSVDKLFKQSSWKEENQDGTDNDKSSSEENEAQLKIMGWAKELQTVSENCGVPGKDLSQMLRQLGLRKRRLANLLPLLEFITWSLLKEDSKGMMPHMWLSAKQRTWKAGTPRYIPNSVWTWICSAEDNVVLDPMTSHSWLQLSGDRRRVQEALSEAVVPVSKQRFNAWPCVLAWEGFCSGRHYWEVDLSSNGYWRLGMTTATSTRQGRFAMTPATGYWVLWRSTHQFYACTKPETSLPIQLVPQKVGIYLDYEEGQISFYDLEKKVHIYTFTDTFREKLYPLFAPLDGQTMITILSPKASKNV